MRRTPAACFATAQVRPQLTDPVEIDRLYRRSRASILVAIFFGYGFLYTCRLGLSVVKRPRATRSCRPAAFSA